MTDNKLLFMGRKIYGATALKWCVENGWDVVAAVTDNHKDTSPTAEAARSLGVRLLDYDGLMNAIQSNEIEFDLAVSYVYWRILKKPLIEKPKLGIINFHPAPLPDLRGTGGFNVAILENHQTFGVTAHYLDEGIDTGPIIEVDRFKINLKLETAKSLEERVIGGWLSYLRKLLRVLKKKRF